MSILVPSFGAMEKEEVDYVTETAIEKEKERVSKSEPRLIQNKIAALTKIAYEAKPGQRAKTIKQAINDY